MKLRLGRRRLHIVAHRRLRPLANTEPVVSFVFDDFPRSAYTIGGRVLRDCGARGTFYAAPGLMDSSTELGDHFRLDDLYSLTAEGHELASHTFHHLSSRTTKLDVFLNDVREGRAALRQVPGLRVSNNFAYPFGAITLAAKKAVGMEMISCRGIYEGLNRSVVDLNLLRANSLYGHADQQLDRVRKLLDDNERLYGWLIFYTHDIRETPSPYGCTPKLFQSAVHMVTARAMKILTVEQVLAKVANSERGV